MAAARRGDEAIGGRLGDRGRVAEHVNRVNAADLPRGGQQDGRGPKRVLVDRVGGVEGQLRAEELRLARRLHRDEAQERRHAVGVGGDDGIVALAIDDELRGAGLAERPQPDREQLARPHVVGGGRLDQEVDHLVAPLQPEAEAAVARARWSVLCRRQPSRVLIQPA